MKIRNLLLAAITALPVVFFAGCSSDNDDNDEPQIILPDTSEGTQNAYADENNTGNGFTFEATQTWFASVTESTPSGYEEPRANNVSWIKLFHNGNETYSGDAGTFNLKIELTPNYTGVTRKATITIISGNDRISITVTQEGKTEEGKVPENPNPNDTGGDSNAKLVSKITVVNSDYKRNDTEIRLQYDNKNRPVRFVTLYYSANDNEAGDNSEIDYEYSGDVEVAFKYTDNAVSFTLTDSEIDNGVTDIDVITGIYNLNSRGYIVSGNTVQEPTSSHSDKVEAALSLNYNNNNYLTKISATEKYTDSDDKITTNKKSYVLAWTNNNLTKVTYSGDYSEGGVDSSWGPYNTTFTYGTIINKANIDLNWIAYSSEWAATMSMEGLGIAGFYGNRNNNLIASETADTYENPESNIKDIHTHDWTLDGEGYPVKLVTTSNTVGWEGTTNTNTTTYTIEYNR